MTRLLAFCEMANMRRNIRSTVISGADAMLPETRFTGMNWTPFTARNERLATLITGFNPRACSISNAVKPGAYLTMIPVCPLVIPSIFQRVG
tara:strand:- start:95 stop:370 length:276 start_codon:yes stop_codon:yes gene_type:complete